MAKQKKHVRRSKKGKRFVAGKKKPEPVPKKIQRQVIKDHSESITNELKRRGKVRIPQVGILKFKIKKARSARWGINQFTKERQRFPAKPRRKVIKFVAAKQLKEAVL